MIGVGIGGNVEDRHRGQFGGATQALARTGDEPFFFHFPEQRLEGHAHVAGDAENLHQVTFARGGGQFAEGFKDVLAAWQRARLDRTAHRSALLRFAMRSPRAGEAFCHQAFALALAVGFALAFGFALALALGFAFVPDLPALAAISSSACSRVTSSGFTSLGRVALILP